ncbi:MAG: PH domain-containing protein [Clostridia bacterium]|nr:PH domain-containing protein [Clostridia bacterium]
MQANAVEDILAGGESILWRDKPDKKALIAAAVFKMLPIAILWLCIDLGFIIGISIGMSRGSIPIAILGFIVPFFLLHLAPVWIWVAGIMKSVAELKNLEYIFTDKRIIIRSGIIGIDFKFLYYNEIESVNVKVSLTDKIFRVGDIYVNAKSSAAVLYDLHNPYNLGTKLQKIVQDITTDINYPNALRPDYNPGYNTKYTDNPFKK